jgi:hypothetical protein
MLAKMPTAFKLGFVFLPEEGARQMEFLHCWVGAGLRHANVRVYLPT